ncbi:MAG: YiiX family permuted papain-like enzyme [Proteobacteria bacterium]|nr:YiiX family permuted papain-like enzyme [Pseudomonadota bacterium]
MKYRIFILSFLFVLFGCSNPSADQLHDGDIIFQTSQSNQSTAIQLATHSKYSHMGIIFFQNGEPYVFEAIRTVQYTPLDQWIGRGQDGKYVIKRLLDSDKLITPKSIEKLKGVAETFQGKPYDLTFEWSDNSIYCSELVWKIYERGIGVQVGQLKKLRDFDLSNAAVKAKMKERYGDQIPMNETVVSPGDMFTSELLQIVKVN